MPPKVQVLSLAYSLNRMAVCAFIQDAVLQGPAKQGILNPNNAGGIFVNEARRCVPYPVGTKKGGGVELLAAPLLQDA